MPLAAGTQLGPYRIVALIGSGGMGEVYRAHDARLGRDVAIKVMPRELAATPEFRARFEREARTISQLNHPHICTLHDRGHQDGIDFLVMELIEGETLAHRLTKGPLPVAETLTLGRQIAEALNRAHRAGVVHRDLKPGNVMLTRSGAKLMDFGLARPTRPAATPAAMTQTPTVSNPLTSEVTILGTAEYMAPEQLEGREADARTDLWALGCVLYEMATGARAFAGESQASLIAAIMTSTPRAITELSPVTPPALERLVQRCLQKDPEARIQSALDVAFVLDLIGAGDPRGAASAPATSGARRTVPALWAIGAALLAIAGFVAGRFTAPPSGEASIRVSALSQGTRDSEPGVSTDGRMIAFTTVRQGGPGIWLMDMASRGEVRLTTGDDHFPRFTPDGGTIVFTRTQKGRQSLWRVPAIGGAPRLLLEDAADADVARDGRIAYVVSTSDSAGVLARLIVTKADGTGGRELWSRRSVLGASPRWSPDGRRIAVGRGGSQNSAGYLVVVDVAGGAAREYPAPNEHLLSNAVWDGTGHGLIVAEGTGVTAIQRGAPGHLFRLDTRTGAYRPLGWLERYPALIDLLPDGRLVLWSPMVRQNLREVAIGARDLSGGRWLTSGLAIDRQPVYSPDGQSVMFSSNRGGTLDLWEVSVETGEMHRVTDDPEDDWDPAYSRDGKSLFWCSGRSGVFEIWTARRDGTAPRQVSRDSLDAENPSVTPDNQSVIYS